MPWRETDAMRERGRFVVDVESGLWTMSELCERYGISRATGYKWWRRYEVAGFTALADHSRAPHRCPHRTARAVERAVVAQRRAHPTWGPVTLRWRLEKLRPDLPLPAASTIGALLQRQGLVTPRRRRRKFRHPGRPYVAMQGPNDVWSADFKGEFRLRNGRYCYPLTVVDGWSRYVLRCQGRASTAHAGAQPVFERLFRQYGLPRQILTDNGTPFASTGVAGLSRLSVWWIKLGIHPIRIAPGCPAQNGRHERMHRTLKAEATRRAARDLGAQQRRFTAFCVCYNTERPHHALGGRTPAELYTPSAQPYPARTPGVEYPAHFEVRKVGGNACLKWRNQVVFVGQPLVGEYVGLEAVADATWAVYFGPVQLARFDERRGVLCH